MSRDCDNTVGGLLGLHLDTEVVVLHIPVQATESTEFLKIAEKIYLLFLFYKAQLS